MSDLLTGVVGFVLRAVVVADGVGVTLLNPHSGDVQIETGSATAGFVADMDVLQHEVFHEGPSLACVESAAPIVSASLGSDVRWSGFGPLAAGLGVHSALSWPLTVGERLIGVITCFAFSRNVFGDDEIRSGVSMSTSAAVAVYNAQLLSGAHDATERLDRALMGRRIIDQAVGILCSRSGCDAAEAIDRLVRAGHEHGVTLAVVARQLVEESTRYA